MLKKPSYLIDILERAFELPLIICSELLRVLIDSVVGQVHEEVLTTTIARINVLLSGETSQTISVHKRCQNGLHLCDENIHSKVKLPIIYQVRLRLILLHNVTFVSRYVLHSAGYKDTLPLALILWLHYQSGTPTCGLFSLRDKGIEVKEFIRCDPGLGEKLELLRECLLH
jgi:hypothetical protein